MYINKPTPFQLHPPLLAAVIQSRRWPPSPHYVVEKRLFMGSNPMVVQMFDNFRQAKEAAERNNQESDAYIDFTVRRINR